MGWQGTEGRPAVKDDRFAVAWCLGLGIDFADLPAGLSDRDAIEVDPPSGETIGGLGGRNDGELGESILLVFLGVETTVDDRACRSQSCQLIIRFPRGSAQETHHQQPTLLDLD